MKVAIVYHFFPHYRAAVLRELLRSTEHEYVLVADEKPSDPSIQPWPVEDRARFIAAPCRSLVFQFLFQKGLLALGLRQDLDAVVYLGNPYFLSTWISAFLARLTGKKVFFWTHGWTRADSGARRWFRWLFYKLSNGLLLYGHAAKMAGLAQGFGVANLHVIYNSLDYDLQKRLFTEVSFDEVRALKGRLFKNPEWPMAICSARLTHSCRFDLLLEAQARLRTEGHFINVLLVGDGPERAAIEAQAEHLHLPVHVYGACYDEPTLARLTMGAHVTVSPGKVGLTALQSLAYGVPVITHDNFEAQGPEWEAIIPPQTGAFFQQGDVADLARRIKDFTAFPLPKPEMRFACSQVLDRFYNPVFQRRAIDRAISGQPADDLFWLRECVG
jgi:glycosyltransferase involved in cell wall biosynthesis